MATMQDPTREQLDAMLTPSGKQPPRERRRQAWREQRQEQKARRMRYHY